MAKPPKPPADQGRSNFLKEQERGRREDAAVAARAEQVRRSLRRLRSGKPASPARRDAARDERIAEGIVAALRAGHRVQLTARTGQGVTDYRSRKRRIKTPAGTTQDITFWTPSWDHAGDALKALAWSQAMHALGGETFSLRLGDDLIETARRSSDGFVAFVMDRIRRRLASAMSVTNIEPQLFLFVEAAYGVKPHLHGALILPEAPMARRALEQALMAGGGDYEPRKNQLLFKPYSSAAGWANYIRKWKLGTAIQLGDGRVCACSNTVRTAARAWYQEARQLGRSVS